MKNDQNIKFTIAIPVYNCRLYVEKALLSALNQENFKNYEILLIDNASDDGSYEILQKYTKFIRLYRNDKKLSMYENHNLCIKKAKGDYILFCHSDDKLREHALSVIDCELSKYLYPNKIIIWGRSLFRDFGFNYEKSGLSINSVLAGANSVLPFLYGGVTPSGTCYSRYSCLNIGGFINCSHNLSPSDWISMIMFALNGFEFKMIDRIIFERRFGSTLNNKISSNDILDSAVNAISELKNKITLSDFEAIINASSNLKPAPLLFYYSCLNNDILKTRIKKIILKRVFENPYIIKNKMVRRILL